MRRLRNTKKVTACAGCRVIYYCGSAYQKADWPNHKKLCKTIQTQIAHVYQALENVKQGLAQSGGDFRAYHQSSPVELESCHHYRYILARNYIKVNTFAGINEGLKICVEVAKLDVQNKQNGQTAREFVPGLYLRLGQDQKCYESLKAKCNGDMEEIYRCDQNGIPRRTAKKEDFSLAHAAMLCVFKLRILRDLRDLDRADTALGNKLPAELSNESRSYLISEATKMDAARMEAIDKREDLKPHMQKIEADLHDLYGYINALDADYFHALADPEKYRKTQPMYQPELPIIEALMQTYDVWAETPGVFAICQDFSRSWGRSTG